jgi:hypothetical protein
LPLSASTWTVKTTSHSSQPQTITVSLMGRTRTTGAVQTGQTTSTCAQEGYPVPTRSSCQISLGEMMKVTVADISTIPSRDEAE